jgi:hypothetical protein
MKLNPKIGYWLYTSVIWSIVIIILALTKYEDFNNYFTFYLAYLFGTLMTLISIPKCEDRESKK